MLGRTQRCLMQLSALVIALCTVVFFPDVGRAATGTAGLWVTPLEIDFGPVGIGSTTALAEVTITNSSVTTLNNFAGGGLSPPFAMSQDCGGSLASGGTCRYYFTFSPTAEGGFSAVSSTSTSLGNIKIKLKGTGVGAKAVYDAHSLDMGTVVLNANATQQIVTLRNVGLAPLNNFAGGGLNAPFGVSQDCGSDVAPGGSCSYYFDFSPSTAGSYTATSTTFSNGGSVTVDLKGSGRNLMSFGSGQRVSPLSLDFGPVGVGTTSPQLKTQIYNQSQYDAITDWSGGSVSSPFSSTQDCASGVPAGNNSCYQYYQFSPVAAGDFTTTSTVTNSAGSFSITLRGTGVAPSYLVSPLWLDFGPVALSSTSPTQIVTITNTGLSPITGWEGGGVNSPFSVSQDCGSSLAVGETCYFYYAFAPATTGFVTAQSRVNTNAGSFTILLQGGAHPAEYSLGVTFPGTGRGSVSSSPAGINCNTDCSQTFTAGSLITLTPVADPFSVFSGWSGSCSGTGNCVVTANADKSVIATFAMDATHKARLGANYYPTLTEAYAAAATSGSVIEASATTFFENLTCSAAKAVTFKGGYTESYLSNSDSYTTLLGILTIGNGSLTVENLIIN